MGVEPVEGRPAELHAGRGLREQDRLRALLVLGGHCDGARRDRWPVPGAAPADLVRVRRLGLHLGPVRGHRSRVSTKLYVIPASHPSTTAELMLQRKGIPYKRRDLITAMHIPILKLMGFPNRTVPAIKHDGRKVQGTRNISRFLDELQPEPPMFPAGRRAEIEEAERWGDEQLQAGPRRLSWFALGRDKGGLQGFMKDYKPGLPKSGAGGPGGPLIWGGQKNKQG